MNVAERNAAARARLKAHYDALGAGQDGEAWYEDPAYDDLIAHGCFEDAGHVVEIGCGTGRFAARLLKDHLAAEAVYYGIDLSPVMVGLTRDRLVPYAARCAVEQGDAVAGLALGDRTADRVVMAFVLDLLTVEEAQAVLAEARRVLVSDGLLCVASLDRGQALGPRLRSFGWSLIHRFAPLKVGGCRPLILPDTLGNGWSITKYVRRSIRNCAIASVCAQPFFGPREGLCESVKQS